MSRGLKKYYFSYTFLGITIILFSPLFFNDENYIFTTIAFLLIVNVTCFSSEYLIIKYYQRNKKKKPKKGYVVFANLQLIYTIIMFIIFRTYII